MNKINLYLFLIFSTYRGGDIYSQISERGIPKSFFLPSAKSATNIPAFNLNTIDTSQLLAEEKVLGITNRYGVVQQTDIDIKQNGQKTIVNGIGYIWLYKIKSPQAYSLGIHFRKYVLPAGAQVFIYNEAHTQIAGAFSSKNNNSSNELAIAEFKGQNAIIEYYEPLNPEFSGELRIGSVSQSYKNVLETARIRIGINCEEGSNWQDIKHAVCLMTFHDSQYAYYCTGFLINNIRDDGTPYFQTANHCISSGGIANTLVTYFNFENSTCNSDDAPLSYTLSGATLKATNSYTDFSLLLLSEYPPDVYNPFYAGWNASARDPKNGTGIHHPEGTPKCIALDFGAPTSYPYSLTWKDEDGNITSRTRPHTHWNVKFDSGGIESGSSGSPLFDDNQRVIGQLHGGSSTDTYYGKFSLSWNYSSVSNQQLKYWLDPDNTGTLTMNGRYTATKPQASFSTKFTNVCMGVPVVLTDQTKYSPKQWNWQIKPTSYEFVNGTNSNSQNPEVVFNESRNYSISLTVTNLNGADSITKINYIAAGKIQVKINGLASDSAICACNMINYNLFALGAANYSFNLERTDKINYSVDSNNIYLSLKSGENKNGTFYSWLKVTGTSGSCAASDSLQIKVLVQPNDNVKNATPLQPGKNATYSNYCATAENYEPYPTRLGCYYSNSWCPTRTDDNILNNTVWFTFLGPSSGKITIDTHGFNNHIAVYEADSYGDLLSGNQSTYRILGANDDRSVYDSTAFLKELAVSPARKYWLQVDGYYGKIGKGTIDLISNSLEVFPNPTNGKFEVIISDANDGVAVLKIYSNIGQILDTQVLNVSHEANRFDFDLSAYTSGMYIIESTINGTTSKAKLIITKFY